MTGAGRGPGGTAIVVKLGGSTLGEHDTALDDIAALSRGGERVVVVHGGGAEITRWLQIHQIPSHFVDGLRVTDEAALRVVVAVLAGAVNKELVAELGGRGVAAFGLCGADGALLEGEVENAALGRVGAVRWVRPAVLEMLLAAGYVPVVAPIAVERGGAGLLNVNADTAAGELAAALPGSLLVFLTDVAGVLDGAGRLVERLTRTEADRLHADGTISSGMIPKVEACLRAADAGSAATIVDGRKAGALRAAVAGEMPGTRAR